MLQCFCYPQLTLVFLDHGCLYLGPLKINLIIFDEYPILDLIVFGSPQLQSDPIELLLQDADILFHAHHLPLIVLDIVV